MPQPVQPLRRSRIRGTGSYLPERIVTNEEIAPLLDASPAWIERQSGITARRYAAPGESTTDMATVASRHALEAAGVEPSQLDWILVATLSPDYFFPGSSAVLQDRLGAGDVPALDIRGQCAGFLYTLSLADAMIQSGRARHVLVVGAEAHSKGLDFSPRSRDISMLFGDGAGAVVLAAEECDPENGTGLLSFHLHADGTGARLLMCEAPGSAMGERYIDVNMVTEGRCSPAMNGRSILLSAGTHLVEVIEEALAAQDWTAESLDFLVPHQGNRRLLEAVTRRLSLPPERVVMNIERVGNTSAASVPIALDEAVRKGAIQPGNRGILAAFGSGLLWGSVALVY